MQHVEEKELKTHSNGNNELWLLRVASNKYTDLSPLILMNKTCHSFFSSGAESSGSFTARVKFWLKYEQHYTLHFPQHNKSSRRYTRHALHSAPRTMPALRSENDKNLQTFMQFFIFSCNSAGSDVWRLKSFTQYALDTVAEQEI